MTTLNRIILLTVITAIHVILILGPVGCFWLKADKEKQKEIAFKVELGGLEPSHAPEVGPPERTRPTGASPAPEPPAPAPEPEPPAPAPEPPAPAPEPPAPKPEPPAPKPAPKPVLPAPKPAPKPVTPQKPKTDPQKAAEKKRQEEKRIKELRAKRQRDAEKKRMQELRARRQREEAAKKARERAEADRRRRLQDSVYRPPGGNNFNPNVKIGIRNTGQEYGKQDKRTPAGGADAATEAEWEKFNRSLQQIIEDKWLPPAGIWVDDSTSVVIAIRLDSSGRVVGRKVLKPSPNAAVTASAERLLKNLNQMPVPPGKAATGWLDIVLKQNR